MGLENVPLAHLCHLVKVHANDIGPKRAEELLADIASDKLGGRAEALAALEAVQPGISDELAETWPYFAQRAIHLWRLPFLKDRDVAEVLDSHELELDASWTSVRKPKNALIFVRRVRATSSAIEAIVYINKPVILEFEETPTTHERTTVVQVELPFTRDVPVIQVSASHHDARSALFAFLDWLRGSETPRTKGPAQAQIMNAVSFEESDITAFAQAEGFGEPIQISGLDASGEVGDLTYNGKKKGAKMRELDPAHQKVKLQLESDNAVRKYNVQHQHDDGYDESTEASFHFKGAMSRVSFHTRASRKVIHWLVDELCDHLNV